MLCEGIGARNETRHIHEWCSYGDVNVTQSRFTSLLSENLYTLSRSDPFRKFQIDILPHFNRRERGRGALSGSHFISVRYSNTDRANKAELMGRKNSLKSSFHMSEIKMSEQVVLHSTTFRE